MLSDIDIYIYTYNESHMTQPTMEVIINHCPSAKMDHWDLLGTNKTPLYIIVYIYIIDIYIIDIYI